MVVAPLFFVTPDLIRGLLEREGEVPASSVSPADEPVLGRKTRENNKLTYLG